MLNFIGHSSRSVVSDFETRDLLARCRATSATMLMGDYYTKLLTGATDACFSNLLNPPWRAPAGRGHG